MTTSLDIARQLLLNPAGLTDTQLQNILASVLGKSIDSADLYFQASQHESWVLEDGLVKQGHYDIERGVGVRAISEEKTGFACSSEILLPTLERACSAARSIVQTGGSGSINIAPAQSLPQYYPTADPLQSLADHDKVDLLRQIDALARQLDHRVSEVIASLSGTYDVVFIFASDGTMAADVRPLVRLNVQVIAEQNGRREKALSGGGKRGDYRYFLESDRYKQYTKEAVRQAVLNLSAIDAPAGTMPVVLGSGWPGVLLHEAVGHGLEGDFNRKGTSAFSGRIGEQVASRACTVVDDGTLAGRRGSLTIDDEGTASQYTVLIEKGILCAYMQDKLNAKLMKMPTTGNGRRESYAHLPLPRMTNTYMLPGDYTPEEIIASVDKGLYAVNFSGGQVDITSGKFVFDTSEAYLIENGKITQAVKGATLIGNGPDVMQKVSMVGNNLALDEGTGTCGKAGQSVPVGVGQPTLKVDALTVGGTE